MSVPFVTGQREQSVESIINEMNAVSGEAVAWVTDAIRRRLAQTRTPRPPRANMRYLDHLLLFTGSTYTDSASGACLRLDLSGGKVTSADSFYLIDPLGQPIPLELSRAEKDENGFITRVSLLLPPDIEVPEDVYCLFTCPTDPPITAKDPLFVKAATPDSEAIDVKFARDGLVSEVSAGGRPRLDQGSLTPVIRYELDGRLREYRPEHLAVTKRERGPFGPPAYEIRGNFALPGSVSRRSGRIETWDPSDQRSPGLLPPRGLLAASADEGVYLHWGKSRDRTAHYKIYYGRQSGRYEREATVANTPLLLKDLKPGDRYYAAISGVDEAGEESPLSQEISFVAGEPVPKPELKLPPALQLKLLWTGIVEKLENNLL